MRAYLSHGLWTVTIVAVISTQAQAQPTIYNWIAQEDVADWNVDENWQATAGNFVPNADEFEGEGALIDNGGTALANVAVPRIAGLSVQNGTVAIPGGGVVETVVDNDNTGDLSIGTAGNVNVSGNGQLTVAGDAGNAGTLRITGPDAQVQFNGDYSMAGTLIAGITGASHSVINVGGEAALDGTLQVEISGTTPAFGQSWDLLNAGNITGNFDTLDAAASPPLPRGLQYQVAQDNGTASLLVGNALVLTVDRQNGSGRIENVVGAPIQIHSYALRSESGLLSAENWESASRTGAAGEGWHEANPTSNHLAELNLTSSFDLQVGAAVDLGSPYDGGPAKPDEEDLVFQYTTEDGRLERGIVEYTGAVNDLVLHVNPDDGAAAIANGSRFIEPPDLTAYAVRSDSGALTVETWDSFGDTGAAGEGWREANPNNRHLAELNLTDAKEFTNGTVIPLGNIFALGSEQDLLFEYTTGSGDLLQGTVQYGQIPSLGTAGDCNGDGVLDAADLACVGDPAERDIVLNALNTLPGDLDGNGDVAFPDFLVLSANFGQEGLGYTDGNIDLAGAVAFADFLILSANFGKTPAAAAAAVPEPSAGVVLACGMLAMGTRARRRRRP